MSEKQIPMNLKVEESLHKAFKSYARKHRDTMTRLLIKYMIDTVNSDSESSSLWERERMKNVTDENEVEATQTQPKEVNA